MWIDIKSNYLLSAFSDIVKTLGFELKISIELMDMDLIRIYFRVHNSSNDSYWTVVCIKPGDLEYEYIKELYEFEKRKRNIPED